MADSAVQPGALDVNILFVCTGNTCRSPMAEAIAQHLLMEHPPHGVKVRVFSAGTSASSGDHASEENAEALRAVGVVGVDVRRHRSQPLSAELVERATVIYVMTNTHAKAVQAMARGAAAQKVKVLDPSGMDIPDPVGRGPGVYRQTAQKLMDVVRQRLAEVIPSASAANATPKDGRKEGSR